MFLHGRGHKSSNNSSSGFLRFIFFCSPLLSGQGDASKKKTFFASGEGGEERENAYVRKAKCVRKKEVLGVSQRERKMKVSFRRFSSCFIGGQPSLFFFCQRLFKGYNVILECLF